MNRISKFAAALALGAFVAVPAVYAQKDDKKKKEEAAKPVKQLLQRIPEGLCPRCGCTGEKEGSGSRSGRVPSC